MLKELKIKGFKSLEDVDLKLGKLNIFIGSNSSGKSNFFDSLRVLQGIGYGLTIDEIFNGKSKTSSSLVWQEIRGGNEWAVFKSTAKKKKKDDSNYFSFESKWNINDKECEFNITINPSKGNVIQEELRFDNYAAYFSTNKKHSIGHQVTVCTQKQSRPPIKSFEKNKPILHQILNNNEGFFDRNRFFEIKGFIEELSNMQKLDLVPSVLREPSRKSKTLRMGEEGQDFPAVVNNILKNKVKKEALIKWLELLSPSDVNDIKPLRTKIGDIYFGVKEGKKIIYAPSLSDGTLRFSALLTEVFQPLESSILMIEEIENGIHPTRLKLIADLIQSRTEKIKTQVFVTTHSPLLLAWLDKSHYEHVFFCYRQKNGSSLVKPLSEIPHLQQAVEEFPINDLFAEGWLESVLTKEAK